MISLLSFLIFKGMIMGKFREAFEGGCYEPNIDFNNTYTGDFWG
jgi:hypothetical protein